MSRQILPSTWIEPKHYGSIASGFGCSMIRKITDQPRLGDSYVALLLRFGPPISSLEGLLWQASLHTCDFIAWSSMRTFGDATYLHLRHSCTAKRMPSLTRRNAATYIRRRYRSAEARTIISVRYSDSNPLSSNFNVRVFSLTVLTTCSGAPCGMSASISRVSFTSAPRSPARWAITSSAT